MKIHSHKVEINNTCPSKYIEAIKKYWVLEKNKFIYKSRALGKPLGFSAYEFANIVKKESKFFIEVQCDTCSNIESKQVRSQSNFGSAISNLYNTKTKLVNCSKCRAEIENQRLEELERQIKIRIEKQNLAINNQVWLDLSPFQLSVLRCIIQNKGISKLNTKFKNTPANTIWSAIYTLQNLNLVILHYKEDTNYVEKVSFLQKLESLLPTVDNTVKSEPKATYNSTSKELKIRLTKNNNVKDEDSPLYSGILNFEKDVHIEKDTQYTFGVWKREYNNLYFTLVPTDSIYKAPKQQSISKQPKHLKDAIQDFFNSSEFDF